MNFSKGTIGSVLKTTAIEIFVKLLKNVLIFFKFASKIKMRLPCKLSNYRLFL